MPSHFLLDLTGPGGQTALGRLDAAHLSDHPSGAAALRDAVAAGDGLGPLLVLERLEVQTAQHRTCMQRGMLVESVYVCHQSHLKLTFRRTRVSPRAWSIGEVLKKDAHVCALQNKWPPVSMQWAPRQKTGTHELMHAPFHALQKAGTLRVTRKASLLGAAASVPSALEDLAEGTLAPGYVASVTGDAVFVRFLGSLTGRAGWLLKPYYCGLSCQPSCAQTCSAFLRARQNLRVMLRPHAPFYQLGVWCLVLSDSKRVVS